MEERRAEMAVMGQKIEDLSHKLDKLEGQVETLLDEWHRAIGILSFIKYLAGVSALFTFIYTYFHGPK